MTPPRYHQEPLSEILTELTRQLGESGHAELLVPHPDLAREQGDVRYPGEPFERDGRSLRHRPLRLWLDLAERLGCRLRLPEPRPPHHILLLFEALAPEEAPWHRSEAPPERKYGADSAFGRLDKLEEPRHLLDLLEALERAAPPFAGRVLSLGVNAGGELDAFALHDPALAESLSFVGIDRAASALALARKRHPSPRHRFLQADVARLDELALGSFDLVLAFDLLQSPGVDDRALLRTLVQRHIAPDGAIILALPNGRHRDGELLYGARTRNYRQPELSLLFKDVGYYRRYLQQHRFQVNVTGKYEVLVVGKRVGGQ